MVNILLDFFHFDEPWLFDELKNYIKPHAKVAVVAFSFRESRVKNAKDWDLLYAKGVGRYYHGIVSAFTAYGISEENIEFLHYFADSKALAKKKIQNADILYFLGGLPDRMMARIREFDLYEDICHHKGILMGYSAGALIQLSEYHLSPDHDYPQFVYEEGFPWLSDFYLEVHYDDKAEQNEAISRVLREKKKPVYAFPVGKGAILAEDGVIRTLGKVKTFYP